MNSLSLSHSLNMCVYVYLHLACTHWRFKLTFYRTSLYTDDDDDDMIIKLSSGRFCNIQHRSRFYQLTILHNINVSECVSCRWFRGEFNDFYFYTHIIIARAWLYVDLHTVRCWHCCSYPTICCLVHTCICINSTDNKACSISLLCTL